MSRAEDTKKTLKHLIDNISFIQDNIEKGKIDQTKEMEEFLKIFEQFKLIFESGEKIPQKILEKVETFNKEIASIKLKYRAFLK